MLMPQPPCAGFWSPACSGAFVFVSPTPRFRGLPPAPQGLPGRSGLGTYIAERTVATQGPWLVVLVLLGIVLTCGDRRQQ